MAQTTDELRHFRTGDRVEFSHEKKLLTGEVQTYRLRMENGGEEQVLNIMVDGALGIGIANVPASGCRLVGRAELPPPPEHLSKGPASEAKAFDVVAIACRALTSRGATLIAVTEIKALATAYIALRDAIANAAASDRTSPYRVGETRADGKAPPPGGRWLTPKELGEVILEGKVPL